MIEYEVGMVMLITYVYRILLGYEGKTFSKFKKKLLKVVD